MATDRPSPLPPPPATAFTVFVDSSLGTHLAMTVSPGDTVADFKRKITIEHALCFPVMGEISVQALKVKRRGAFYHLSDTMLVMRAFDGNKGTWFLHVDVRDKSISKHQGGGAGHFVNDGREHPDDRYQLILNPRRNLEEDLQLNRNNISIDDGSTLHEKTNCIGLVRKPTPGSCQIESLIDASIGQLAAGGHNADEPTHKPIDEHKEVFNNGGSLGDKETSNLENVAGEVHLGTDMDTLLDPEDYPSKLPAGDSSLIEHLTGDKKKKKKGSRSSKSQQTEVDSAMPLNDHRTILSPTSAEQNVEHGCPLEKNDVLGYVPAVMEGNSEEALVHNQKDLIKKIDDGTNQTSENIAYEDSAGFDSSEKNVVPGFNSENMAKCSYSNHLSGTNNPGKAVEAGTSEVALNCNPNAVIVGPNVSHITKEAVPLAEVNCQIPNNFHSKKRSSKRLSKNALGSNDPTHSTAFANEEKPKELLGSDHKDTNKESDTRTNKEAPSHGDIANLDTENPSADDVRRSHHKKRRKSEKAASAEFQSNNHEPVQSFQNLTDKENLQEKLNVQKQQESVVSTEVDVHANSAAQDSVFPSKPDHASTSKEATIHEDSAILDTEYPSADYVGKLRHKRRRKSDKAASAESQPNSHEPVQSLQNLTNKENLEEKLDDQKQQELVGTTEVDVLDPSADVVGRSRHKERRKSEKAAYAESQPNRHEPVQSLQNFTNKENLEEKLDDRKQQEFVVTTEVDVLTNSAAQDSVFPPKPEDTRIHKEAPCHEDIAKLATENPSTDDVVRSHHKKRRKSEKAGSAESQLNSHEPVQSLRNLTDKENLQEKLDEQKQQELVVTTEVDVLANSAAHDSVFPPKPDDTRIHKEAPGHEDIAKLDTENPSADNVGRSHHKKRKKSAKAGSAQFQRNNHEEAGSAEFQPNNPEEAGSAELQPNNHEPVQSLQNLASKQNLQEKLDEQKQQELVVATEAEVFANHEALDSKFPPKLDAKSHRKKKKSSKIEVEVHETAQQDFSHSLVTEVAEARAKETMDDHHSEQSRQSELLANHGEATIGGSANVNLVVSSGTNDKSRRHHKRKSAKSHLSYNTPDHHDLIYSSEGHTKENFEKASTATDDPVGASNDDALPKEYEQSTFLENESKKHSAGLFDNLSTKYECNPAILSNHGDLKGTLSSTSENPGKELPLIMLHKGTAESAELNKSRRLPNVDGENINFTDAFCQTAVQNESVVSGHELPSTEPKPKKQHKSKRKRKLSKHDTTHDLADLSESDKQNVTISEHHTNDTGNQDSVDPIVKPSSRVFNNTKVHYSVNDGGNLSDWMSSQNSHDISRGRVKEKIQGNKHDTSHQLSVSQDEQSKHVYRSKEKTFTRTATKSPDHHDASSPNYIQDETVQVKENEIVNVKAHSIQSQSKSTESLANPAASSDSTQENTSVQANKYKLAVRKVPNKIMGKKSDTYQLKIPFVTSGAIFDDATGESSEGEFDLKNRNATKTAALDSPSSLYDSDEDLESMQIGSRKSAEEGLNGEDIILSQSSMSTKGMPLGTILRSTSSYKKAKVLASQSQADSESQPVDVVLETQPED